MKAKINLYLLVIVPLLIGSAFIVGRHDVDDQKYLDYGASGGFESLALFAGGNGTLIDSQWVITAEHVAMDLGKGSPVTIGGKEYQIEEVVIYPQEKTDNVYLKKDIALVKLNAKVTHVKPVRILRKSPEVGAMIHLAGNGGIGNGRDGQSETRSTDKKVRGATNIIEQVTEIYTHFVFDDPASGKATALEGVPGFRDSGGPAYIKQDGELILAGVSSFQTASNGIENAHYGVREHYVNVASFTNWIETTIKGQGYYETTVDKKSMIAILEDYKVLSLTIDGKKASDQEIQQYGPQLIQDYYELSTRNSADRIPLFLNFLKQLALNAKIIDTPQDVAFKFNRQEAYINGKKLSDEDHKKVINKYESLFDVTLQPGENINYNPLENN